MNGTFASNRCTITGSSAMGRRLDVSTLPDPRIAVRTSPYPSSLTSTLRQHARNRVAAQGRTGGGKGPGGTTDIWHDRPSLPEDKLGRSLVHGTLRRRRPGKQAAHPPCTSG